MRDKFAFFLTLALFSAMAPRATCQNLIANGSFETVAPAMTVGEICRTQGSHYPASYPTCAADQWTGTYQIGNNGGIKGIGGSTFGIPQPNPNGYQALILQSASGIVPTASQTITAQDGGVYTLSFYAANRSVYCCTGPQTISVLLDGTAVPGATYTNLSGAWTREVAELTLTAGSHSLTLQGSTNTSGDISAFLDDVSLTPGAPISLPVSLINNGSFETVSPNLAAGGICRTANSTYPYSVCQVTPWTGVFQIANGQTAFNVPQPDPDGSSVLILQSSGGTVPTATQPIIAPVDDNYTLSFFVAGRGSGSTQTVTVLIDGAAVPNGTFGSLAPTWTAETLVIPLTAGTHNVTLQGSSNASGDVTAFVDDISLFELTGAIFSAQGATNGASFVTGFSAGELATIFGTHLSNVTGIVGASTLPLPTQLSGVSVIVNGVAAPLVAIANVGGQEQLNLQVPYEAGVSPYAQVVIVNNGVVSAPELVPVYPVQPGIFAGGTDAAALHANNAAITESNPAAHGETIVLFATGAGPITNSPLTGDPASGDLLSKTAYTPVVTIGGEGATVSFSGLAPGFVGLNQINVVVPQGAPSGDDDLVVTVNKVASKTVKLPVE